MDIAVARSVFVEASREVLKRNDTFKNKFFTYSPSLFMAWGITTGSGKSTRVSCLPRCAASHAALGLAAPSLASPPSLSMRSPPIRPLNAYTSPAGMWRRHGKRSSYEPSGQSPTKASLSAGRTEPSEIRIQCPTCSMSNVYLPTMHTVPW